MAIVNMLGITAPMYLVTIKGYGQINDKLIKIGNERENKMHWTASQNRTSKLATVLKASSFATGLAFLIFAAYLQINRPESPDSAKEFLTYMKFFGRPFYVSSSEAVISDIFLYLFPFFGIFAIYFDRLSKSK